VAAKVNPPAMRTTQFRKLLFCVSVALPLTVSACGDDGGDEGGDGTDTNNTDTNNTDTNNNDTNDTNDGGDFGSANVAACNDYLDTLMALPCWDPIYDPMIDCQAIYGGVTTCDISEYFDCIAATYSCADGTLTVDAEAAQACASLATCA
jgi:hypothetical protein